MLAAVFEAAGHPLVIDRVPDPCADPNELVVRVGACGICGSDIHAANHADAAFGHPLPAGAILGHEFAGEIVEIGTGAQGHWRLGDRVAGFPIFSCGSCDACRSEHVANCRAARFVGLSGAQGAYAEYVRVPSAHTVPLASHTSFQTAALIEPLAVCLHAVRSAMPVRDASVLIIGAGPIGLILAATCRFFGARDVVVSDLVAQRATRALATGATAAIDASSEDVRESFRAAAGRRPTIVFDAAGGADGLARAIDLAGQAARVIVVAAQAANSAISTMTGFYKELTISFAKAYTASAFREAARMIEANEIDITSVVTDIVGFDAFPTIFESLSRPTTRGKVLLEPFPPQPRILNVTYNRS